MSEFLFFNNAITTLGSSLSNSATTLTVATGTGVNFPSPGAGQVFSATLVGATTTTGVPNEIVYVTNRTGDTFTIIRGQEGTTPAAWAVGDTVANMPTAAFLNQQATTQEIQTQAGNYAADTGAANAGSITLSPVPANLAALIGIPIRVLKMANANTGGYLLTVNSLAATAVKLGGAALAAGMLAGATVFEVVFDGTSFDLVSAPAVTPNAFLAQMATKTVKANLTGGAAAPQDVTVADLYAAFATFLPFMQPWVNLTGTRVPGTTYTNENTYPIMVSFTCGGVSSSGAFIQMLVGGIQTGLFDCNIGGNSLVGTIYGIVPPGETYEIIAHNVTPQYWAETE